MKTIKSVTYVYCVEQSGACDTAIIHRSTHEIPRSVAEARDSLVRSHYIDDIGHKDFQRVVREMFADKRVTRLRREFAYL